jgi:2,4-dienoyl-CoA reductase-like NADH-dependent reductase (Old Yellow Enzyme family)
MAGNRPVPFEGPDSMSVQAIEDTIAAFAQAATDAKRLGFDAIEIHGGHGYLIDQFFWARTNNRQDDYGGKTLQERTRFGAEVVKTIRTAVGPEFTIIMRLSQWKSTDFEAKVATAPRNWKSGSHRSPRLGSISFTPRPAATGSQNLKGQTWAWRAGIEKLPGGP